MTNKEQPFTDKDKPQANEIIRVSVALPSENDGDMIYNEIVPLQKISFIHTNEGRTTIFFDDFRFPDLGDNKEVCITMDNDPGPSKAFGWRSLGTHCIRIEATQANIEKGVIWCDTLNTRRQEFFRQL